LPASATTLLSSFDARAYLTQAFANVKRMRNSVRATVRREQKQNESRGVGNTSPTTPLRLSQGAQKQGEHYHCYVCVKYQQAKRQGDFRNTLADFRNTWGVVFPKNARSRKLPFI
jgi:hypothetical protein